MSSAPERPRAARCLSPSMSMAKPQAWLWPMKQPRRQLGLSWKGQGWGPAAALTPSHSPVQSTPSLAQGTHGRKVLLRGCSPKKEASRGRSELPTLRVTKRLRPGTSEAPSDTTLACLSDCPTGSYPRYSCLHPFCREWPLSAKLLLILQSPALLLSSTETSLPPTLDVTSWVLPIPSLLVPEVPP